MGDEIIAFSNDTIFMEYGLEGVAGHQFSNKNLIIGKNGAGKTRFLKAVENYYKQHKDKLEVITLYFPETRSGFSPNDAAESEDEVSLYDAVYYDSSLSFKDFLKLAEKDSTVFLEDLFNGLNIHAKGARQRRLEDLKKLNEFFSALLGGFFLNEKVDGHIAISRPERSLKTQYLEECLPQLSPGELMLFYLGTFLFYLHYSKGKRRKIVLLMDEPELHLHPKALLTMIDMLYNSEAISQLWIATHSIFILPQFPFESLVYLGQSKVLKRNSTTYQHIYNDLIGLDNLDMYELLHSMENWENYQFVIENFLLPQTKGAASRKDEQTIKVLEVLRGIQAERPLKVLDYGAGKCRVWECLKLAVPDAKKLNSLLSYEAYDVYPDPERPKNVVYHTSLKEVTNSGKYDVVILMNVLHEIEPRKWCNIFQRICSFLTNDGILIFLEVHSLTNGEQPYGQAGYLLLRDKQVKRLFPHAYQKGLPNTFSIEKTNCWVIPSEDVGKIRPVAVVEALYSLEKECEGLLKKIDEERIEIAHDKQIDMKVRKSNARYYAFLSQQYINAHFAYQRYKQELAIGKDRRDDKSPVNSDKVIFPGLTKP
ncbi:AAA family ATPase [Acutalibacter sp. JLR.KK004]|jgi:hypothetical protein|uniref:AAA family ATPase n=1 Tax=Acutalibacter sp. JLR.KK004 TaxID=3112622 RepID=UPI002FF1D0B6|nr:AAA family ATPase [Bacillota bacterium]MCI9073937.1 AAA family ATPase [Lachnospiraceae bacterium]